MNEKIEKIIEEAKKKKGTEAYKKTAQDAGLLDMKVAECVIATHS
jgi:hypothetical protein